MSKLRFPQDAFENAMNLELSGMRSRAKNVERADVLVATLNEQLPEGVEALDQVRMAIFELLEEGSYMEPAELQAMAEWRLEQANLA